MIKVEWIDADQMLEGLRRFKDAADKAAVEIGKQISYDIIGVPPPSR